MKCRDCQGDINFTAGLWLAKSDRPLVCPATDSAHRPSSYNCPATGEPHQFERNSDDQHGEYIACAECGASSNIQPTRPIRSWNPPRMVPVFDEPDEWSMR